MFRFFCIALFHLSLSLFALSSPTPTQHLSARVVKGINDFSCRSSSNPVILLHGLGANFQSDINLLQAFLAERGFCTFSTTYGAHPGFPDIGGATRVKESSKTLRSYVQEVLKQTGKRKVDLVGHSEGGFMALYVPKAFPEITANISQSIALGPPTHGATVSGLTNLGPVTGILLGILTVIGCEACHDLIPNGDGVKFLNDGKVTQAGIKYTIIASNTDEVVTPAPFASFVEEPGVNNVLVQNLCPADKVKHGQEPNDKNIQQIVLNNLQNKPNRAFNCVYDNTNSV